MLRSPPRLLAVTGQTLKLDGSAATLAVTGAGTLGRFSLDNVVVERRSPPPAVGQQIAAIVPGVLI